MQPPHVTQQGSMRARRGQSSKQASTGEILQGSGLEQGHRRERQKGQIWRCRAWRKLEIPQKSLGLAVKDMPPEWMTLSLRKGPFSR